MLTKCGCAISVHLQLDLLKFYLAILKMLSWCCFCAVHVSAARSLQRTREVNSREELVSSWSSAFVCSFRHGGALLVLIAPGEAGLFSLPSSAKWKSLPRGKHACSRLAGCLKEASKTAPAQVRGGFACSTQKLKWLLTQPAYGWIHLWLMLFILCRKHQD